MAVNLEHYMVCYICMTFGARGLAWRTFWTILLAGDQSSLQSAVDKECDIHYQELETLHTFFSLK